MIGYVVRLKTPSHKTQLRGICSGYFFNVVSYFVRTFKSSVDLIETLHCGATSQHRGEQTCYKLGLLFIYRFTFRDEWCACVCLHVSVCDLQVYFALRFQCAVFPEIVLKTKQKNVRSFLLYESAQNTMCRLLSFF